MGSGSEGTLSVLLSGLIASIVASGAALLFSFWFERFRHRQAVAIEVLELTDEIATSYLRMQLGTGHIETAIERSQELLLLIRSQSSILAKVVFAFGEGRVSRLVLDVLNAYVEALEKSVDDGELGSWTRDAVLGTEMKIGPLRRQLAELLVERARLPASWMEIDAALTRKRLR